MILHDPRNTRPRETHRDRSCRFALDPRSDPSSPHFILQTRLVVFTFGRQRRTYYWLQFETLDDLGLPYPHRLLCSAIGVGSRVPITTPHSRVVFEELASQRKENTTRTALKKRRNGHGFRAARRWDPNFNA